VACGGSGSQSAPSPTPDVPPAIRELASMSGMKPVRYRLTTVDSPPFDGGSTISIKDSHTQREFPPPVPLSGTLEFIPVSPLPEGVRFAVTLSSYDVESEVFSARYPFPLPPNGTIGGITAGAGGDDDVAVPES
jgi:hypothetical protein